MQYMVTIPVCISGGRASVTFAASTLVLVLPALGMELDSRDTCIPELIAWHGTVADVSHR